MLNADPNNQSIIAFGVVVVLVLLGLAARLVMSRSKRTKDRPDTSGQLFL
ncbi:hypothetical protein ACFSM5_08020 [Lacibacterium aquatile]|uniref:LPXTG cell wall anchor domain-containing protein n=1 Tax=Lacibacterium aquatile TaxID=1168082 RepID=A0ABW5DQR0_9PROT